jgi:PAS domain S-box-containing protein
MGEDRAEAGERSAGRIGADRLARRLPPAAITLLRALVVFAGTFATGALGLALPHFGARLALPILPSGIAVAALVRWGRGLWPAVFAAELAIELFNGNGPVQSVVIACGLPLGAWLTAWLLERYRFERTFAHSRDVPLFLAATVAGMVLPATFGSLGFALGPAATPGNDLVSWLRWWSNTTAGVLLVAPLLIAARAESLDRLRARPLTGFALVLIVAVVALLPLELVRDAVDPAMLRAPLIVVSLVLVVIGALRFGLVASAATTLAISAVAALSFAFNRGLLQDLEPLPGLVLLWSYVGSATGLVLLVTALLAERDAAAAERLQAERRYAEVFEASPQPLWVHDPATLGFLLVNRATERQYGFSRDALLGMRVTDLAAPGEERAVPASDAAPRAGGEPFETRHVDRDGRVLDVEMWDRRIDFGGRSAVLVFATDATERKMLGRAFIDAIAGEQRRIGQEMHDGLGQELTGVSLSTRALANRASRERLPVASELDQLAAHIATCIKSAQHIVRGLSPLAGADGNLVAALGQLAEHGSAGGIAVRFQSRLEAPLTLPLEARNHLYRIAQEALQNAQKHAAARHVDIEFTVRADVVRLAVLDDGHGLAEPARRGSGLGMRGMRYRAAAIGGRLSVRPRSPSGTAVLCDAPQLPLAQSALRA